MNNRHWNKVRYLIAAVLIIAAVLCCAAAMAETAQDITAACKFNAGSGRKSFARCKDRNYKTFWQTDNGPRAYVEVTVPAGQAVSPPSRLNPRVQPLSNSFSARKRIPSPLLRLIRPSSIINQ